MTEDRPDGPFSDGPLHDRADFAAPDGRQSFRKRRQRSHSSPELYQPASSIEYPFPQTATSSNTTASSIDPSSSAAQHTMTSDSSSNPSTRAEDSLTLRRREANRLAAQRFRSRKKGYQDSLEERIRVLEEERDGLLRRLGEQPDPKARADDEPFPRYPSYNPPSNHRQHSSFSGPSVSPERREAVDIEVRVAALESANRRLQDELKGVYEENDRLHEELESWRRRERDLRGDGIRRFEEQSRGPLSPMDSTAYHAPPTFHSAHPPLERARSFNHPARPPSPGLRLPPLRLPPLPPTMSQVRGMPSPPIGSFPHPPSFRGPSPRHPSSPSRERGRPSE